MPGGDEDGGLTRVLCGHSNSVTIARLPVFGVTGPKVTGRPATRSLAQTLCQCLYCAGQCCHDLLGLMDGMLVLSDSRVLAQKKIRCVSAGSIMVGSLSDFSLDFELGFFPC